MMKQKPGPKPPKEPQHSYALRIPQSEWQRLLAIADRTGLSVNQLITNAIRKIEKK